MRGLPPALDLRRNKFEEERDEKDEDEEEILLVGHYGRTRKKKDDNFGATGSFQHHLSQKRALHLPAQKQKNVFIKARSTVFAD